MDLGIDKNEVNVPYIPTPDIKWYIDIDIVEVVVVFFLIAPGKIASASNEPQMTLNATRSKVHHICSASILEF